MKGTQSIKRFLNQIYLTSRSYPLVIAGGLIGFIFWVLSFYQVPGPTNQVQVFRKLLIEAFLGMPLLFSITLIFKRYNLDNYAKVGLMGLMCCLLGIHYYSFASPLYIIKGYQLLNVVLYATCFHLVASFAVYTDKNSLWAFWHYNQYLFIRVWASILFCLIIFLGLSGALWAIDTLFGLPISADWYVNLLGLVVWLVLPYFVCGNMPQSLEYFEDYIDFPKGLKVFCEFVLLPLLLLYLGILIFYTGRIVYLNRLPNGWVAIPVLIYAATGTLMYLLVYPLKESPTQHWATLYCRWFFFSLLPLLTVLFIAVGKRIDVYGFTEGRLLSLYLGLWFSVLSLYFLFSRYDNIKVVPISLFVLLLLALLPPYNIFQLSVKSQYRRLEKILAQNQLLNTQGILEYGSSKSSADIPEKDKENMVSIIHYLHDRDALHMMDSMLNDETRAYLDEMQQPGSYFNVESLVGFNSSLGVGGRMTGLFTTYYFHRSNDQTEAVVLTGFDSVWRLNLVNEMEVGPFSSTDSSTILKGAFRLTDNCLLRMYLPDTVDYIDLRFAADKLVRIVEQRNQTFGEGTFLKENINPINRLYQDVQLKTDSLTFDTAYNNCRYRVLVDYAEVLRKDSLRYIKILNGYLLKTRQRDVTLEQ